MSGEPVDDAEGLPEDALVLRLGDELRSTLDREKGMDLLEQLVRVLDEHHDRLLCRELADLIVEQLPWLSAIDDDEARRANAVIADALEQGTGLLDPSDTGVSHNSVDNALRLLTVTQTLEGLLPADSDDRAAETRTCLMVNELLLLGRLGKAEEQGEVFDELLSLGQVTADACDRVVRATAEFAVDDRLPDTAIGPMFLKAQALAEDDQIDEARTACVELIDRFADRSDRHIVAVLASVREFDEHLGRTRVSWLSRPISAQPLILAAGLAAGVTCSILIWRARRQRA